MISVRRILLALLCLLALAASASAEGAWVLWVGASKPLPGVSSYAADTTFPGMRECISALDKVSADWRTTKLGVKPIVVKRPAPTTLWMEGEGGSDVMQCLPDTVDPRGPKWPKGK